MHGRTYNKFLAVGFDTILIDKCDAAHLTFSGLSGLSQPALVNLGFTSDECTVILSKVNRQPISQNALQEISNKTGKVCCYCADCVASRPYQIHHITEYHLTQDNSGDNLLLVCPTHHAAIHRNNISVEEQKLKRTQWGNIYVIAKEYQDRGLVFPFEAFEYYDYGQKPDIKEVFDFAGPSLATCVSVLDLGNKVSARRILDEQHMLVATGSSGSGKTTFVKGLAGTITGFGVYNYIFRKNVSNAATEILTFLSVAVQPVVVIVDNANVHLTEGQIEAILKGAGDRKKLMIIKTRGSVATDDNIEQHFVGATFPISWAVLKRGIRDQLLKNELEVIKYLNAHQFDSGSTFGIGQGHLHEPLSHVIDKYAGSVETAYQFFYLFASGIKKLDALQVELAGYDDLDVILLYLAIHQIALVENGANLAEIADQYTQLSTFKGKPAPEPEWVKSQMDVLQKKRVIRIERGRYNTVHREFAREFIDHCYFKRKVVTEEILLRIFDDPNRVAEIAPLWSWLEHTQARNFTRAWATRMTPNGWQLLVKNACEKGVAVVSLLADDMFHKTFGGQLDIQNAFKSSTAKIAELISEDKQLHIYYLRRLVGALNRLEPEAIQEIFEKIDHTVISSLIKNSEPGYFQDLEWLFNQIGEHYPAWVADIRVQFSDADFENIIRKIAPGRIDELQAVVSFQRTYIKDIPKSQYFKYTAKFAELLKNCPLGDIHYEGTLSSAFFELNLYPDEIKNILDSLNITQLSKELVEGPPRDWDNLLMLAILSDAISTDIFEQVVEGIAVDQLTRNIENYYQLYHHELRIFLYFLGYGSEEKRKSIAEALKPMIRSILTGNGLKDSDDVFKAYYSLNEPAGEAIANELQIPLPEKHIKNEFAQWDDFRKEIQKIEETETDYPMSRVRQI